MSTFYFNDTAVTADQYASIQDAMQGGNEELAYEILDEARLANAPARMKSMVDTLMGAVTPVAAGVKPSKAFKPTVVKAAKTGTKQEKAVEIYTRLAGDKAAVIAAIMTELSMSTAGATTYFYNAKKLAK